MILIIKYEILLAKFNLKEFLLIKIILLNKIPILILDQFF